MVRIAGVHQRQRKKKRLLATGLILLLLAAAGTLLYRLPLSLQDIRSVIQLAAGKFSDTPADLASAEPVLRGSVFDRKFREVAVSYTMFSLSVRPAVLGDKKNASELLADALGVNRKEIAERLKKAGPHGVIADNIERERADAIRDLHLEGISLDSREVRFYPEHATAAHLIGYAKNNIGLFGIEGLYDTVLQPGVFKSGDVPEIDFQGKQTLGKRKTDIILTLDLDLQKVMETRLTEWLEAQQLDRLSGIVMNPKTGAVLAMSNIPAFNPNYFWQATDADRKNSYTEDSLDFSLLEPLLARCAATMKDSNLSALQPPEDVAAPSYGLSPKELADFSRTVALFTPVSCTLPGCNEEPAVQQAPDRETEGEHGAVTALKITRTMANLLNGGWNIEPYVLEAVYDHDTRDFFYRAKNDNRDSRSRILPPVMGVRILRDLEHIRQSDQENIQLITSTCRTTGKDSNAGPKYQSLLLGWAPKNRPEILLVIAGQRSHYAPSKPWPTDRDADFAAIGKAILAAYQGEDSHSSESSFPVTFNQEHYKRFLLTRSIGFQSAPESRNRQTSGTMPNLVGLSLRKGLQKLNHLNLKIIIQGSGTITAQTPAPGESLDSDTTCILTLNRNAPATKK